jgi:outer membrane protein OmpA-like peptidoglycan-associated protein
MKNAKSKIRFIETFAIATFPIALAVGCSATGDKSAAAIGLQETGMHEEVAIEQQTDINTNDLNTLSYIETEQTYTETQFDEIPTEMPSMQSAEGIDSTLEHDTTVAETNTLQVNLQVPEPAKVDKPQTNIFHFAFNKYDVDEQDYVLLKEHAEYLLENSNVVVNVNGYSDNRGSAKNNFEVSKKRAQQIANILTTYGVPESQIKVNGYGESFPLHDEKNWEENRRVELEYSEDTDTNGLIVSAF